MSSKCRLSTLSDMTSQSLFIPAFESIPGQGADEKAGSMAGCTVRNSGAMTIKTILKVGAGIFGSLLWCAGLENAQSKNSNQHRQCGNDIFSATPWCPLYIIYENGSAIQRVLARRIAGDPPTKECKAGRCIRGRIVRFSGEVSMGMCEPARWLAAEATIRGILRGGASRGIA